ncbi:S8 family serine peptidase [Salibacter sp.]|uniref:S8 family serine peptidase n=1 Tax=Salibacter sp. TaxID=2010995 RepID=UPI0028704EA8|nr:S8 family serine peptidase [Salibacter sp.]MDR9487774.1 S8 family serine peptidase [Salibacter sp.]
MRYSLLVAIGLFTGLTAFAQNESYEKVKQEIKTEELNQYQQHLNEKFEKFNEQVEEFARKYGRSAVFNIEDDGTVSQLIGFDKRGFPIYYITDNVNAAISIRTDSVMPGIPGSFNLTGNTITIGEWDGGDVLDTHQEFGSRANNNDNGSTSSHATHVAGTMIASGVNPSAKGMATAANLEAWDFGGDEPEMTGFAGAGNILSNHSYGTITGWRYVSSQSTWRWYGDTTISANEDDNFGRYNSTSADWDSIAVLNPYYLMVKSAGNDRNDGPNNQPVNHEVWDGSGWVSSSTIRAQDCPTGYDCMSSSSVSKNVLTIAAVPDVPNYTGPSSVNMSSFSGWGPTDDGRIKPDISANGVALLSSDDDNDSDYSTKSGTSMSAPSVTGSIALLQDLQDSLYSSFLKSATMKALIIETALEAGSAPGPDYEYGWGLMNTKKAADVIAGSINDTILEESLSNTSTYTLNVSSDGQQPLSATIAWTDVVGDVTFSNPLNNPALKLKNDLDLRIIGPNGTVTYDPYILDPSNPSNAATTGDNFRDNVEKVYIANPVAGNYTIEVTHKGNLINGPQDFGLVVTGKAPFTPTSGPPTAAYTVSDSVICVGETVTFTDASTGNVVSQSWTFNGGTPGISTAANPQVSYAAAGSYDVQLIVTNASGVSDTITKVNHITVDTVPQVSFTFLNDLCVNAGDYPLTGNATPSGGTFTGPGVSGNLIDPVAAGLGFHDIIYTVTNGVCSASDTATTEIISVPTISHPDVGPVCDNTIPFTPQGGTPPNGDYTGPGFTNNIFYPDSTSIGIDTIAYSFTDSNSCTVVDSFTIEMVAGPNVVVNDTQVCENVGSFVMNNASPTGGTFWGSGIDSTTNTFDPSVNGVDTTVFYYSANTGSCTAQDSGFIVVDSAPNVSFTLQSQYCLGTGTVDLSAVASPAGGTFQGPGITGSTFDPNAVGAGSYTIQYLVANPNGCADSVSQSFTVASCGPQAQFLASDTGICLGNSIEFEDVSLAGAVDRTWFFEGGNPTNSTNSIVNVTYDTVGVFDVVLIAEDTAGVFDTLTLVDYIQVDSVVQPQINFLNDVCINAGQIFMNATPSGGVFSGSSVFGNFFDPDTAGIGFDTIYYEYTNGVCAASDTHVTEVVPVPTVTHPDLTAICEGSAPFNPNLGTPQGGDYTGNGFFNNIFYPDSMGVGTDTAVYSYTDTNACTVVDTFEVTVVPGGSVSLADTLGICDNATPFTLNTGSPAGGVYLGSGIDTATGIFDPSMVGPGIVSYQYSANVGGCVATDTAVIEVVGSPQVSLSQQALVCAGADTVDLDGGSPLGGVYSGAGITNNQFDASAVGVGNYLITYTYTDSNMCPAQDTATLSVVSNIQVTMSDSADICSTSESFDLMLGDPFGGVYSGPGIVNSGKKFKPQNVGAGSYDIIYSYDTNGCSGVDTATLDVIQGPTASLDPFAPVCVSQDTLELTGGSPAGGVYDAPGIDSIYVFPSQLGEGIYDIDYTVTDTSTGCFLTVTEPLEVTDGNSEIGGLDTAYCENDGPVTMSGSPAGGTFAGVGVFGVTFDPDLANDGLHRIEYRVTQGCTDTATKWVRVHPAPVVDSIQGSIAAVQGNSYTYFVAANNGTGYNWTANGGTITNVNNNVITVEWGTGSVGSLMVTQTNRFGCMDTATLDVDLFPLGVAVAKQIDKMSIYPNPVRDMLTIKGSLDERATATYRLMSITGQTLRTGRFNNPQNVNERIDVSDYASGIYFVVIQSENYTRTEKVVVQ